MQVCTSLQTDNHPSTPPLSFFAGRMTFLPPNQQRQSTEDNVTKQLVNARSSATADGPRDALSVEILSTAARLYGQVVQHIRNT